MTPVTLRRATREDRDLLLAWRNDPVTRAASFNSDEVTPDEHDEWLVRKLADRDCALLVAEDEGEPVGQVRFDRRGATAEVDIAVAPARRGRGLGTELLRLAAPTARRALGVERVTARVKHDNAASLRAFEKAGFERTGESAGVVELALPDGL